MSAIFIRERDPRLRTDDGVLVPDSWFRKFGEDVASVETDDWRGHGGYRVTTFADLGRQKRQRQAERIERKREPEFVIRPLYVWVFHCPGFAFMGWWTYLIGRGISDGKELRRTPIIDRIIELFPCGLLLPAHDDWAPVFARRYAVRYPAGRLRLHAGKIQGKAPVWARCSGSRVEEILCATTWPSERSVES